MVNVESVGNKGVEVIEALCEKFGLVIDWTSENVVPYLQDLMGRIVKYEIATSIFWIIFISIFFIISLLLFIKSNKNNPDSGTSFIFSILTGILLFMVTSIIPFQIYDIIEALTIPEKTVIDLISMIGG